MTTVLLYLFGSSFARRLSCSGFYPCPILVVWPGGGCARSCFAFPLMNPPSGCLPSIVWPILARCLFSSMTSFTKCPETSFTLRRERSERGSISGDAMEDDGCQRAAGEVCGGSFSAGEAIQHFV